MAVIITAIKYYAAFNRSLTCVIVYMRGDQPVTFLEEFQTNISFAEYGDGDNLAAIWVGTNNQQIYGHEDLWMDVNVANNQQTYNWDDLISMNTIYNNIIAEANHSNTILDNFLTIEGNHINAIQGDLNIDVERLTTIYDDPINIEEERLATVQDNTIDVEENIVQNENINVFELIKKYLPSYILSVQKQQIEGSLLYRATLISKESAKDIQDQDDQLKLQETVDVLTQFQQNNNVEMMNDLHLFKNFRPQCAFTSEIKKQVRREVRYVQGFGKVKKALNLALDLKCEDEFLDMISNFITRKKSSIESTSNEENLCVLDPLVQKRRGCRPNKRIKSATEKSHHSSFGNSAINPPDPNLTSRKRRGRLPKLVSEKKANQNNSDNVLLNVSDYEDTNLVLHGASSVKTCLSEVCS
ncbi:24276_t:CDS:2 [Dentiscutata erythropus]|uniref:24276_t:CDS:1 n=1 Tax=Dentiscutata erythropus TaxID=1348616 RepID=A0A9N9AI91_9GLOM|nr:24276_t:CDS:2 [Dentiscutata erythropus]